MPANLEFQAFLAGAGLLLTLGACSNGELPKWLTGEPSQAEIAAYSGPIAMPPAPGRNQPYPNLADVPERPRPALYPPTRQDEVNNLKKENAEGQAAVQEFNTEMASSPQPNQTVQK